MSLKVGDEVYVRGVIRRDDYDTNYPFVVELPHAAMIRANSEMLTHASRVTVAKARRAARMPEDFGKEAWFSDDGVNWCDGKLCGLRENYDANWLDRQGDRWKFCEVEE